ncbi:gem-associated protein 8-like [Watersipora subatra]|uniref:gem-associated protein 8-like n=1 Tax=Watersipora subatra TaxID=2589382 RepID=UPI00355B9449
MGPSEIPSYPSGFARYWTHYNFMHSWIQKHHRVLTNSSGSEQRYPQTSHPQNQDTLFKVPTVSNYIPKGPSQISGNGCSRVTARSLTPESQPKAKKRKAKHHNRPASPAGSLRLSTEDTYIEAELNKQFLEFMQQSALHKKEREAAKLKNSEEQMEVDANGLPLSEKIRMSAPTEQPGMRRTHEIRLLYGDQSHKIHGLETAQQLCFQQACDKKKPLHWPNIPLRLEFT